MYALCRLLDSIVDTVQWATQGDKAQGAPDDWRTTISTELAKIPDGDVFSKHMVRSTREVQSCLALSFVLCVACL